MATNDLDARLDKALACLNFVVGMLGRAKDGLGPEEIEGLVYILSDIVGVFEETMAFVLAQGEGT